MNLAAELQQQIDSAAILDNGASLGRLSDDERRIAATQRPANRDLILERDVEIGAGDFTFYATLRAYGRFHRAYPGDREHRLERPISPPEPAHFSIDKVTLQGSEVAEVDITDAVSEYGLELIGEAAMEGQE